MRNIFCVRFSLCYGLQCGFTFIELLVSMSIMMVVGSIMLIVFFTSVQGVEKSQRLISLRQNGNFALSRIMKTVQFAQDFSQDTSCDGTTELSSVGVVAFPGQQNLTYACVSGGPEGNTIVSENANGERVPLVDPATVQTVQCSFTCGYQPPYNIPYLKIRFSLIPAGRDVTKTDTPQLPFSSTVILKNADK